MSDTIDFLAPRPLTDAERRKADLRTGVDDGITALLAAEFMYQEGRWAEGDDLVRVVQTRGRERVQEAENGLGRATHPSQEIMSHGASIAVKDHFTAMRDEGQRMIDLALALSNKFRFRAPAPTEPAE